MALIVITGCSSGIGLETALAFARAGDTPVATMRDLRKAAQLRRRAEEENLEVHLEQLDVCDDASTTDAIDRITANHGPIDVLVNNAGILGRGSVETMSIDHAVLLMETNFWGPIRTIRAVLPGMRAQGSGVIVNVSSIAGRLPALPHGSLYTCSKRALGALSEALATEVGPFGIRVVAIEPGFFKTEIAANYAPIDEPTADAYEADRRWFSIFVDGGVAGGADPSQVAQAIVSAASDPTTPLHTPVGDDAQMYLAMFEEVGGYEGWSGALLPQLEAAMGPRPTAA